MPHTTTGRAEALGFDPEPGPWVSACWTHGTVMNHATRALARQAVAIVGGVRYMEGCEDCMEELDAHEQEKG